MHSMSFYGLHTRSNGNYPRLIEDRDLTFEWDELVELTGISTDTFESDLIPSGVKLQIIRELNAYKTMGNDMHLMEAADLTSPFVDESDVEDSTTDVVVDDSTTDVVVEDSTTDYSAPSASDIAILAFAQEFPMRDLRDYDISGIVTLAVENLPSATVSSVANGIKLFKWIGLPNYNPEQMVKLITLSVQRNLDISTLDDLMRTPEYCMDEHRRESVRASFGDPVAERFIDFCESDVDARLEDLSLANYNLARILGIDEFDFDEFVIDHMATQISTKQPVEVTKEVVKSIVEDTASEAKSTDNIVSEVAKNRGSSGAFIRGEPVSKALAWSILGASAIALGLLVNKLRKF